MKPLLSILIATRNRNNYCKKAIETILSFDYENFELIIQDNSDTLELYDYISKRKSDIRLVYNYTSPPFSSIDNFNAVIDLANGKYLCLIGDDDGINPEIFKLIEWADEKNIDAITPGLNIMYRWPDACPLLEGYENDNGSLEILPISYKIYFSDTDRAVRKLMKNGGQDYLSMNFPKLYHGVVKAEHMNKIKEKIGYYVGGLSPDIYIAVALTAFIPKVLVIDYPITISGVCRPSAERVVAKYKKMTDSVHFRDRSTYNWSKEVPMINRGSTIWADSALAALRDLKRYDLLNQFNTTKLAFHLIRNHIECKEAIQNTYFENNNANHFLAKQLLMTIFKMKSYYFVLFQLVKRIYIKIQNIYKLLILNEFQKRYKYIGVNNIQEATTITKEHLSRNSLSVNCIVKNRLIL